MPCLNEIEALRWILPRVPRSLKVIVVDNGSTDGSVEFARDWGATVIEHPITAEVGRCIELGVSSAETDIVCICDCDGTIDPVDLLRLVAPIVVGKVDFVVGARTPVGRPRSRLQVAQSALRDLITRIAQPDWPFSDLGTARAFRRSAALTQGTRNQRFAWNLDVTARGIEAIPPSRVTEVAVPYSTRISSSKISAHPVGRLVAILDHLRVIGGIAARSARALPAARAAAPPRGVSRLARTT